MTRLPTLLRTLWYLRREQLQALLAHRLRGPVAPRRLAGPPPRLRCAAPRVPWLPAPPHARCAAGLARIELLNRSVEARPEPPWTSDACGPLFAYHLHQFDWARHPQLTAADRERALRSWLAHHRAGIGWDPGPISLRSFAWLKLLTTPGALPEEAGFRDACLASLADQLATLEGRLERHLLANHYLSNLLALVFAGALLDGSRAAAWRGHAGRLAEQLDEQILPDGLHCERSPMYHALMLEHVLDLANALAAAPHAELAPLAARLPGVAGRMLGALRVLTHPDGGIALFGDAAHGIAQSPDQLERHAAALGVAVQTPEPAGLLQAAGFARLEAGPFTLLATASPPLPVYQPGHAHCDALSFELSVGSERVVSDTGVYEYVPGAKRDQARSTRAHATVQIDDREQAELWAAHRVGGRPDAAIVKWEPGVAVEAVCSGWATPEVLHRRRFEVAADGVRIHDRFDRPAPRARLLLPLAPGLEPELAGAGARVALRSGALLSIALPEVARWRVERAPCFPEFGREESRAVLVGEAEGLVEARWLIRP